MIVVAIFGLIAGMFGMLIDLIPHVPVPDFIESSVPGLRAALGASASMGVWIPLQLAGTVAGLILSCALGGGVIKIGRIVASFLSAGGGSAG